MDRSSRSIRSAQQAALRLTGLALLVSLAAGPSSALAQDEPPPEPVEPVTREIGLLFNQTAKSGSLRALAGKDSDRYLLTLNDPGHQVIWFQDRPGRQSGHLPLAGFVGAAWKGFGFAEDPPNAALSVLDGADHADTAILTLGRPRYDAAKRKLRYPARAEAEATGNLAHFEHDHDPGAVKRFRHAALFIDDAAAPVIDGCVIQPYAQCPNANLRGADLTGVNLTGVNFTRADLSDANIDRANLTYANLTGAQLTYADLYSANLTGALLIGVNLGGASLVRADLEGTDLRSADLAYAALTNANLSDANIARANLTDANLARTTLVRADLRSATLARANLTDANLTDADLSSAYLAGANLTNANLTNTRFCNTVMPDGSRNEPC